MLRFPGGHLYVGGTFGGSIHWGDQELVAGGQADFSPNCYGDDARRLRQVGAAGSGRAPDRPAGEELERQQRAQFHLERAGRPAVAPHRQRHGARDLNLKAGRSGAGHAFTVRRPEQG